MKQLDPIFERWGFTWKILERTNDYALLNQFHEEDAPHYNVCKIKKAKETEIYGRSYPEHEILPCAEEYGRLAWNYGPDLEKAREKYNELTK